MAKVTIKPLAEPDSPIYDQPLSIGARFTKPSPSHPLDDVDLKESPFDPAVEAGDASLGVAKSEGKA